MKTNGLQTRYFLFGSLKSGVTRIVGSGLPGMAMKTNYPDSDESVRRNHPDTADDPTQDVEPSYPGLQTSTKSGKHSTVEKLAASRPEFGSGRASQPVPGAFGHDEQTHSPTGRNASSGTNQHRCKTCGRFFNTQAELSEHAIECRAAKAATAATRDRGDQ